MSWNASDWHRTGTSALALFQKKMSTTARQLMSWNASDWHRTGTSALALYQKKMSTTPALVLTALRPFVSTGTALLDRYCSHLNS